MELEWRIKSTVCVLSAPIQIKMQRLHCAVLRKNCLCFLEAN